jgi:rhodanese-related sulfurtransferase
MSLRTRVAFAALTLLTLALAAPVSDARSNGLAQPAAAAQANPAVTAGTVKRRLARKQRVVFLDTRDTIDGETVRGAVHVPVDVVEAWARQARKSDYVVAFCTCEDDGLALIAVDKLRKLGFTNAWALTGGLDAARAAGIPMGQPSAR